MTYGQLITKITDYLRKANNNISDSELTFLVNSHYRMMMDSAWMASYPHLHFPFTPQKSVEQWLVEHQTNKRGMTLT